MEYTYTIFTFEDNKLLFFGFIEDYHRSEFDVIRDLGVEISDVLKFKMEKL